MRGSLHKDSQQTLREKEKEKEREKHSSKFKEVLEWIKYLFINRTKLALNHTLIFKLAEQKL